MTAAPEYPRSGRWCLNAEVYERHRRECAETAERMRREGNVAGAERFEAQAAEWRQRRDAEQRRYDMQILNRRVNRGLF